MQVAGEDGEKMEMSVSVRFYGGPFDGLTLTFDPGPPPERLSFSSLAPWYEKTPDGGLKFTCVPDVDYEYFLEYVDPETFSPLMRGDDIEPMAIYVPEPIDLFFKIEQ